MSRKMKKKSNLLKLLGLLVIALFFNQKHQAQTLGDSTKITIGDVFKMVYANHPIVKQAQFLPELAKMEVRIARGNFDPKFYSGFQEKLFKGTRYYNNLEADLKVPVWVGDIKGSFERYRGDFINPLDDTPFEGLYTLGYSLPIGQGLLFDARRNALRQAQLMIGMAQADQIKLINKILLQVAKDYWDWYFTFRQLLNVDSTYNLAFIRFEGVKDLVKYGNQSLLDSLEALNNLQLREIQLQQSKLQFQNATLQLSNHFWDDNQQPIQLKETSYPDFIATNQAILQPKMLDSLLQLAETRHPEIVIIRLKIDQLGFERRFYREMLKPVVNLEYNVLTFPNNPSNIGSNEYLRNNYKAGFTVEMPLFLRKERGRLRQTNIKIDQTLLEQTQLIREITNEIRMSYNDIKTFEQLVRRQRDLVRNNRLMLEGELERFRNGESSIFIIIARETTLINTQLMLVEFEAKYAKATAFLYWSAGLENWLPPYDR